MVPLVYTFLINTVYLFHCAQVAERKFFMNLMVSYLLMNMFSVLKILIWDMDIDANVMADFTERSIKVYSAEQSAWSEHTPSNQTNGHRPLHLFYHDNSHFDSLGTKQKYKIFSV